MAQNFHEASKHDNRFLVLCFFFLIMGGTNQDYDSSLFRVYCIGPFVTISFPTDAPKGPLPFYPHISLISTYSLSYYAE